MSISARCWEDLSAAFLPASWLFQIEADRTDDGEVFASVLSHWCDDAIGFIVRQLDGWRLFLHQGEEELTFTNPEEIVGYLRYGQLAAR